jgi:exosortase/archaeosortase family protein
MSKRKEIKKTEKAQIKKKQKKKEAQKKSIKDFIPLILAVALWVITLSLLHLPSIKNDVQYFFTNFTINSTILFGKLLFIPIQSHNYPNITVDGFTMKVVMECTAYNFYIFVIYLSLFSPVKFKQRMITLVIFLDAVFIVNNLRFIVLGYIGQHSASVFHYLHDYLWNILFGLMVFIIWAWRYGGFESVKNEMKVN